MIKAMYQQEYPMKLFLTARTKAASIDRSTLLNPPVVPPSDRKIPLIVTFDPRHTLVSTQLANSKFLLDQVKPPLNAKFFLTFRRNKNFKNHLVKSQLSHTQTARGTTPCGKSRCETCPQTLTVHTVRSTSNSSTLRHLLHNTCGVPHQVFKMLYTIHRPDQQPCFTDVLVRVTVLSLISFRFIILKCTITHLPSPRSLMFTSACRSEGV